MWSFDHEPIPSLPKEKNQEIKKKREKKDCTYTAYYFGCRQHNSLRTKSDMIQAQSQQPQFGAVIVNILAPQCHVSEFDHDIPWLQVRALARP